MPARVHNLPRPKRYRDGKARRKAAERIASHSQIAHWAWIDDDAKIDISLANTFHHPLLRTIVQDKLNIWIAAMAFSNALRNKMRGNGLAGSDPNFSAQLLPIRPVSRNVLLSSSSSR